MALLADKKILITGVLSNRSIAYGIAQACQREGATLAFTYVNDELKERVVKLAADFGTCPVLPCDVTRDEQIDALFDIARGEWGGLDGLAAFDRVRAARSAGRRLPRRHCRATPSRSRTSELELQLRRAGRGRATADAGPQRVAADAHLPRRRCARSPTTT